MSLEDDAAIARILDEHSLPPEELIIEAHVEQEVRGMPLSNVAHVSPGTFAGMARRLNARTNQRLDVAPDLYVSTMLIHTAYGTVEVVSDRSIGRNDNIKLSTNEDALVMVTPLDQLSPARLQRRFELEEAAAVRAMEKAQATRTAMNR